MPRTLIFTALRSMGLPSFLRSLKRGGVTVLSLHRVSEENDPFFQPLRPAQFEDLVRYTTKHYTVLSFAELLGLRNSPKKPPLVFSFDDGYYDFYEYALPILRKYGLPSNHNIVNQCANTGLPIWTHRLNRIFAHSSESGTRLSFVDEATVFDSQDSKDWMSFYLQVFRHLLDSPAPKREVLLIEKERHLATSPCRMMSWDEIRDCSRNGVEIGSHTFSHDSLPTITHDETLSHEILGSKIEIETKIGKPIDVLAVPNGQSSERVEEFASNAGYKFVLLVNDAVLRLSSSQSVHRIDRINMVNEGYSEMILRMELFHAKLRRYV